ncbi:MAG: ATPase [Gallionellales bacterium GWA2_55_18]|nr:MAG: ATPase [Gallionellales bacterium GWA2_55_18]
MFFQDELKLHLDARIAVVNVVTTEEGRALREIMELASRPGWPEGEGLYTWDIGDQFVCFRKAREPFDDKREATTDTILRMIRDYKGSATFILKDFHQIWEAKRGALRSLRNLAAQLPETQPRKNIIIITPEYCLPLELKHDVPVLELAKPNAEEMDALLERTAGASGALAQVEPALRVKLVVAALGLTSTQAERVFRKAVVTASRGRAGARLDERCADLITEEKCAIIRESGALELYPYVENADRIGGLDELKSWLELRRMAFSEEARNYGLSKPRGVALIGITGTGKSLTAKVAAGMWSQPLLRLDMGAVFGGVLGASEKNMREAMQIAEVIAPCVLWVDEIEKAFAGSIGDSGTAARVLATFLTWMQEKQAPVSVFATANNIRHLPPEFLRKGRFDEVFFLDLPTLHEREEILEVLLRQNRITDIRNKFDLPRVARETEGFVGAELEAVVNAAQFPAFIDGGREIETADLLNAVSTMVPLAKSHREHIEELRKLVLFGQARNASRSTKVEEVNIENLRDNRVPDESGPRKPERKMDL